MSGTPSETPRRSQRKKPTAPAPAASVAPVQKAAPSCFSSGDIRNGDTQILHGINNNSGYVGAVGNGSDAAAPRIFVSGAISNTAGQFLDGINNNSGYVAGAAKGGEA